MRRPLGAATSSGDWVAKQVLVAMVVLLVQFGLGMWVNLYGRIPSNHPGTNPSDVGAALLTCAFLIRVPMRSPEIGRIPRSQRRNPAPAAPSAL